MLIVSTYRKSQNIHNTQGGLMRDNSIDSISEVIQIIRNHEKKYGAKFRLYDSKLQKIFLYISIATYIAAVIIAFTHPTGIYDFVAAVS
jgi:hypothetical protein